MDPLFLLMMKLFFSLIFLSQISSAFSSPSPDDIKKTAQKLAFKREWQVLLHYKKNGFGGFKSEADGEKFFFAEDGKTNPINEMVASVEAMSRDDLAGNLNHPQCAFPARFNYLKKTFGLQVKPVECKDFEWWKSNLPFQSITVIFASYYANNPSSIFGHTFLRINSSDKTNISDYGVDFSAITDTDHGVEFAVRGLIGGYPGIYSLKPYYIKLNEYIENENRDLWEYDLNLSPEQISRMLDHLWELMNRTHFDYFFLDENCSYQLLTLLEVANPDWKLSDEFVYNTIPIDSVKKLLRTKDAVKEWHYRPAYKKTVVQRLNRLSSSERKDLQDLLEGKKSVAEENSPKVLEATIASLRYERFEKKKFSKENEALLKELQLRRASLGGQVVYPDVKETLPVMILKPDNSHDSQKLSLSGGHNSQLGTYGELAFRASLHDLLDPDSGYPKNSMIEMGNFKFRYSGEQKNLFIQEIKYAEAISLFPSDGHEFKFSWRAGGKTYRVYDQTCDQCTSTMLKSGIGVATEMRSLDIDLYSMLLMNAEVAKGFYRGYRVAPALSLGGAWTLKNNLKALYDVEFARDLNRASFYREVRVTHQLGLSLSYELKHEWRVMAQSWESVKDQSPVEEIQIGYSFYY